MKKKLNKADKHYDRISKKLAKSRELFSSTIETTNRISKDLSEISRKKREINRYLSMMAIGVWVVFFAVLIFNAVNGRI